MQDRFTFYLKTGFYSSILLSILLTSACSGNEIKKLPPIVLQDSVGIERATNVELLYSDSVFVRVAINAPTLLRHIDKEKPKQVFPDGVEADFYNEQHVQTSKMIAKYAEQFQKERKVYLRDSVRIWNNKKECLETDELIWDESKELISSSQPVKIITPTQVIHGVGFQSNLDFTNWKLYQVSGIIESKNVVDAPF